MQYNGKKELLALMHSIGKIVILPWWSFNLMTSVRALHTGGSLVSMLETPPKITCFWTGC